MAGKTHKKAEKAKRKRARKDARKEASERRTIELVAETLAAIEKRRAAERAEIEADLDRAFSVVAADTYNFPRRFADRMRRHGLHPIEIAALFRESTLPDRIV